MRRQKIAKHKTSYISRSAMIELMTVGVEKDDRSVLYCEKDHRPMLRGGGNVGRLGYGPSFN